jgi:phytoene synthase
MVEHTLEAILRYRVDMRHCRQLLRHGSLSFYAASLLLPGYYRAPITALYAFCRVADDEIDRHSGHVQALDELKSRLQAVYAGTPGNDSVDRALANTVERFDIPIALPAALLEGFEWDVVGRRYADLPGLYAYAARVAGTVGAMAAKLMGARDPEVLARACDLGVAMQLTNIARDVGEDARAGRIYLPTDWLQSADIDPDEWLARPYFSPALGDVIKRLLDAAEMLYQRSASGITLPRNWRRTGAPRTRFHQPAHGSR